MCGSGGLCLTPGSLVAALSLSPSLSDPHTRSALPFNINKVTFLPERCQVLWPGAHYERLGVRLGQVVLGR